MDNDRKNVTEGMHQGQRDDDAMIDETIRSQIGAGE